MTRARQFCHSCGAGAADAAFPPGRRAARAPLLCVDCIHAESAPPSVVPARAALIITRASYRAALRARAASPQGDLVDLLVPAP